MRNFVISPDGFPYILLLLAITIITGFINIYVAIIPFIFLIFVTFFFRNPPRKIKKDDKIILSPADGKILSITEIDEDEYLKCKAVKVSIFLSLFNVHVNRTPIAGKVEYIKYRPGKFLPAFKSHASEINERNTIGLNNGDIKVLVHQITGFIARRIVSWVKIGDVLQQGQLYGLIKFGSCTEIVIPADRVELKVKEGDTVKGGLTIIGVIRDEN
ncbi:phosphatidylserine decarboxylase family protein [Caloranaerobacter azorensis]|uniref:Phosphatidylserine decarboxylase proenzyme n=1 Tax=Caloranaerobacter azorensis TaxID=116090 RepID=A0A6P1Y9F0_9FIRM|nr:phosphatidylserine decarboxylase family protein [Caloranaerobacter azorensis]QIB25969.1 phosphatidylserine decarboxylase family protein [Caloranaerobacter azorensis]